MAAFGEILRRSQGAKDADRSMGPLGASDRLVSRRQDARIGPFVGRTVDARQTPLHSGPSR